jgi:hypothetical protein
MTAADEEVWDSVGVDAGGGGSGGDGDGDALSGVGQS